MERETILGLIPQQPPFRFIDTLTHVSPDLIEGSYFFKKDEYFYKGHFPDLPITPSVILTETMAQVGLIPLGLVNYLENNQMNSLTGIKPIFTNSDVKFTKTVFPETKVTVVAKKIYFRLNRLKANVKLYNDRDQLCASGTLSGMILTNKDLEI